MTRFGEILPPSKICISLWPFLKGLFSIWQPDQNTLAKLFCFWENLQCCKLANIEQINLTIWSHCHPSTAELWLKNFTILKVPKSTNIFTLDQSKVGFIKLFIARLVKILVNFLLVKRIVDSYLRFTFTLVYRERLHAWCARYLVLLLK